MEQLKLRNQAFLASASYILNTKYWILNIAESRTNSPEGQVVSHRVARS
jgi:hypothetical protein